MRGQWHCARRPRVSKLLSGSGPGAAEIQDLRLHIGRIKKNGNCKTSIDDDIVRSVAPLFNGGG